MKKNFLKLAAVAALMLVIAAGSVQAQSVRKQKKQIKNETEMLKLQREQEKVKQGYEQEDRELQRKREMEDNAHKQALQNANTGEAPCAIYDDAEWFTAFGQKQVKQSGMSLAPTTLLRTLQQQLLLKLKGTYKAVVRDYADQMEFLEGDEGSSYAVSHIESAGERIMNQKINETYEVCRKQSGVNAQGYIVMYMAIRISKKEIIDEIVKEISEDKKMGVRWNEKQFRDSAFDVFKNSKDKEFNEFQNSQNQ